MSVRVTRVEKVGEVVEVGVGAGSAVEASVSSAMVQSLHGCTLTLLNAIRLTAVAMAAELVPNAFKVSCLKKISQKKNVVVEFHNCISERSVAENLTSEFSMEPRQQKKRF